MISCGLRLRSFPRVKGTIQYVQNLSHPYIILTHAFVLPSRTLGRFSITSPSLDQTSTTMAFDKYASSKISGNLWILCVPKIISTF